MKNKKVKTGDLRIDPKLTELRHINLIFVSRYRQAYREEASMPALIIQERTNRVVSGNHRLTALLAEYGKDHKIEVIERHFANELEVLEFFTKENATHGSPIDNFTKKKITRALLNEGATPERVASLFNISVQRVEKLGDGIIKVEIGSGKKKKTVDLPVKHGFNPERVITESEYKEHEIKDRGFPVATQCNQLTRWLEKDLIAITENNIAVLDLLHRELGKWLEKTRKKEKIAV